MWGAAWLYNDEVYVAANGQGGQSTSIGVWKLDKSSINVGAKTVSLTWVSNSAKVGTNDGMNCMTGYYDNFSPFDVQPYPCTTTHSAIQILNAPGGLSGDKTVKELSISDGDNP